LADDPVTQRHHRVGGEDHVVGKLFRDNIPLGAGELLRDINRHRALGMSGFVQMRRFDDELVAGVAQEMDSPGRSAGENETSGWRLIAHRNATPRSPRIGARLPAVGSSYFTCTWFSVTRTTCPQTSGAVVTSMKHTTSPFL